VRDYIFFFKFIQDVYSEGIYYFIKIQANINSAKRRRIFLFRNCALTLFIVLPKPISQYRIPLGTYKRVCTVLFIVRYEGSFGNSFAVLTSLRASQSPETDIDSEAEQHVLKMKGADYSRVYIKPTGGIFGSPKDRFFTFRSTHRTSGICLRRDDLLRYRVIARFLFQLNELNVGASIREGEREMGSRKLTRRKIRRR